jgi:hypothetical protein
MSEIIIPLNAPFSLSESSDEEESKEQDEKLKKLIDLCFEGSETVDMLKIGEKIKTFVAQIPYSEEFDDCLIYSREIEVIDRMGISYCFFQSHSLMILFRKDVDRVEKDLVKYKALDVALVFDEGKKPSNEEIKKDLVKLYQRLSGEFY